MNILIMGPAGSGKGSMSTLIKDKYKIAHISTGDMLRENVKQQTQLGLTAQSYMESGKLVPDDLINEMVRERIQQPDCQNGYLLDGFPRTLNQAKAFEQMTDEINKKIDLVIDLKVEIGDLANRITGRRICKKCGEIYHIITKPPLKEGVCDICGGELIQRKDDTLEQLQVRLAEHKNNTEPVLKFYHEKGLVKEINASQPINEVFKSVEKAIVSISKKQGI